MCLRWLLHRSCSNITPLIYRLPDGAGENTLTRGAYATGASSTRRYEVRFLLLRSARTTTAKHSYLPLRDPSLSVKVPPPFSPVCPYTAALLGGEDQRPAAGCVGPKERPWRAPARARPDGEPCRRRVLQEQAVPGAVGLQVSLSPACMYGGSRAG